MSSKDMHDTVRLDLRGSEVLPEEDIMTTLLSELPQRRPAAARRQPPPQMEAGAASDAPRPTAKKHDTVRLNLRRNTMAPKEDVVAALLSEPAAGNAAPGFFAAEDDDPDAAAAPSTLIVPDLAHCKSVFSVPEEDAQTESESSSTAASDAEIADAAQKLIEMLRNSDA